MNWPEAPLGSLFERITYGFTNPMETTESGPFMVTAKDIHDGQIDYETARRTSPESYNTRLTDKSRPRVGDLLLTKDGSIGRLAICDREPLCINQSVALLQPLPTTNVSFVKYLLETPHFQAKMAADSDGSTIKHIYITRVDKMLIPVPPLPEQQAIAEVLGALDDKIAANRALVATMEQLMTAKIAALPITGALEDLCSLSKQSVSPESMAPEVWHYSLPAFDAGALPSLEKREGIKSNKFVVAQPSVLLSKLNPRFPRVWNLPSPQKDSVASTEFLVLEPRALDSSVLWALLSSPRVSGFLGEHAAGTSGSHQRVKPGEVMQLPMPTVVPHDLAEELAALGLRGEAARHEAATLASLRDTLLPALMDGTLRVKDVEKTVSEAP